MSAAEALPKLARRLNAPAPPRSALAKPEAPLMSAALIRVKPSGAGRAGYSPTNSLRQRPQIVIGIVAVPIR